MFASMIDRQYVLFDVGDGITSDKILQIFIIVD